MGNRIISIKNRMRCMITYNGAGTDAGAFIYVRFVIWKWSCLSGPFDTTSDDWAECFREATVPINSATNAAAGSHDFFEQYYDMGIEVPAGTAISTRKMSNSRRGTVSKTNKKFVVFDKTFTVFSPDYTGYGNGHKNYARFQFETKPEIVEFNGDDDVDCTKGYAVMFCMWSPTHPTVDFHQNASWETDVARELWFQDEF